MVFSSDQRGQHAPAPKVGVAVFQTVEDTNSVRERIRSEARLLSGQASSGVGGQPAEGLAPHRPAVERVVAAMREVADGPLSLRDMADVACLSPYHFSRVFKGVTGVPPGEFMGALRLERAKQLLLTTELSVGQVCFEVGYESLGTFTSRFTRLVGVPPGRMRRLPEELSSAFERGSEPARSLPETAALDAGVAFGISGPRPEGALIFVGLFHGAIPQGRRAAGGILTAPGNYRLSPVPDGTYHLMAAALPYFNDPSKLLPGDALRVGRGERLVLVRGGRSDGVADVTLRPTRNTDPPVLVALPALFLERLGLGRARDKEQDRRSAHTGGGVTFGHARGP